MDRTREYDLGRLEEMRDMGNVEAKKVLDRAYKEANDRNIETYRKDLIKAHKEGDVAKTEIIEARINSYTTRIYGKRKQG